MKRGIALLGAVLLLGAAQSASARECANVSLAGMASASSSNSWRYPPSAVNNVRGIVVQPSVSDGARTIRSARVQHWDAAGGVWVDVRGQSGQANPIVDWVLPRSSADGSETRQFDFAPITTTRVRLLVEDGTTEGLSHLDEIEAYGP